MIDWGRFIKIKSEITNNEMHRGMVPVGDQRTLTKL